MADESSTNKTIKSKYDELRGLRFGRLFVVSNPIRKRGFRYYVCKCDCGNEKTVRADALVSGFTTSCGCYNKEINAEKSMRSRKQNEYLVNGNTVIVTLSSSEKQMICDLDDWNRLKSHCWGIDNHGYAKTNLHKNDTLISKKFHINVIGEKDGFCIDHINRNKLDNRKANLRHITIRGNVLNRPINKNNTSGTTGVYRVNKSDKWRAYIFSDGEYHYLGRFSTKEEAIEARRQGELKYHAHVLEAAGGTS